MRFRRAVPADIPSIMEIRLSVEENVLSNPALVTAEDCAAYLEERGRGWVCESDGRIVGFSYAASEDHSIWALFVLPEYQGRGIGRNLLCLAVEWLISIGAEEVRLATETNTRAERFYSAQGWVRGAMKNETEVWFRLALSR
jgi:GNAT superfamily N-acetyltransferase